MSNALASLHLALPAWMQPPPTAATSPPLIVPPHLPISAETYAALLDIRVPLTIATLYAVTAHLMNHRATGQPYAIAKTRLFKLFVIVHNVFLAVYSAWTFIGMVKGVHRSVDRSSGIEGFVASLCRIRGATRGVLYGTAANATTGMEEGSWGQTNVVGQNGLDQGLWEEALAWYGWWFYLSKFYEVVDTAIIILKGRKSSLLQTYHHAGAMISMWAGMRYMAPPIWIFCVFNSLIHTLMYTYYTISALRLRVPSFLKRLLTSLQITQFIVGGSTAVLHLFVMLEKDVPCLSNNGEAWAVVVNGAYLTPLTWLFVSFFVESYVKPKKPVQKKA